MQQQPPTGDVHNIDRLFIMHFLLGNLLTWHSCRCNLMHRQSKHCCGPSTPPHGNCTPIWQWTPSGTMHPDTAQKLPRNRYTRHWLGLQIDQNPIWLNICGTCLTYPTLTRTRQKTGIKKSISRDWNGIATPMTKDMRHMFPTAHQDRTATSECCLLTSAQHSIQSHPWSWLEN